MILETKTQYLNGTHYVRIPAAMARVLKLQKNNQYKAKFEQDEVYNGEEFVFKITGEKKNDQQ